MQKEQILPLAQQAMQAIYPRMVPLFEKYAERLKVNRQMIGLLITAITFDPQPISPSLLQKRIPYTNASYYLEGLEYARDNYLMEETGSGEFKLTAVTRQLTLELLGDIRKLFADADPLPDAESRHLGEQLAKLAHTMAENPPSPEHRSAGRSYAIMPAPEPPLPYIEQAISCLNAYRDDSHLAAWQPSGMSATALEALTFIWRGDVDSLDSLYERLTFRNHPKETYATALEELRGLGYIEGSDNAPIMTAKGAAFRELVERDTDEIFFQPWTVLSQAEVNEIGELLTKLYEGLKAKE